MKSTPVYFQSNQLVTLNKQIAINFVFLSQFEINFLCDDVLTLVTNLVTLFAMRLTFLHAIVNNNINFLFQEFQLKKAFTASSRIVNLQCAPPVNSKVPRSIISIYSILLFCVQIKLRQLNRLGLLN